MMVPSAWVSTTAGSVVSPPQWPECTPPGRRSTTRSKWNVPRVPVAIVGTSGITRGPSLAISTSAASSSVCAATNSRRPIEPRSSQVSSTSFRLKPSLPPRSASTASSAERFTACWPLLSALPRPYQRSASSVRRPGIEAGAPLVLQAAHGVAMAVGQDGRPRRVFEAFGGQDRAEAVARIGVDGDGEAQAFQPGPDRARRGSAARRLRGRGPAKCWGSPPVRPAGRGTPPLSKNSSDRPTAPSRVPIGGI